MEIEYKGEKMHIASKYRKNGDDLIVFLPGGGCLKEQFIDAWKVDELQYYSLLTIDYVGYGDSTKSNRFPYTMEALAEIVIQLLKELKHNQIHIVAHSMGGAIALLAAEELEKNLKTFVNVEGNLIGEDCGILSRKTISVPYEEFSKSIFAQVQESMANSEEKGSQLWVTWSKKTDPYAFYKNMESLVDWSYNGELMQRFISLPIRKAYFYGENNFSDLTKQLKQLDQIPIFEISDSGHFVMNDNPQEFYLKFSYLLQE